jgi:hypothetical protein
MRRDFEDGPTPMSGVGQEILGRRPLLSIFLPPHFSAHSFNRWGKQTDWQKDAGQEWKPGSNPTTL